VECFGLLNRPFDSYRFEVEHSRFSLSVLRLSAARLTRHSLADWLNKCNINFAD
jgi:hypothetical protein